MFLSIARNLYPMWRLKSIPWWSLINDQHPISLAFSIIRDCSFSPIVVSQVLKFIVVSLYLIRNSIWPLIYGVIWVIFPVIALFVAVICSILLLQFFEGFCKFWPLWWSKLLKSIFSLPYYQRTCSGNNTHWSIILN